MRMICLAVLLLLSGCCSSNCCNPCEPQCVSAAGALKAAPTIASPPASNRVYEDAAGRVTFDLTISKEVLSQAREQLRRSGLAGSDGGNEYYMHRT